jgi:hypothetical protein
MDKRSPPSEQAPDAQIGLYLPLALVLHESHQILADHRVSLLPVHRI